jgi:glycosyltransferase involved in cell wall biosynthesis
MNEQRNSGRLGSFGHDTRADDVGPVDSFLVGGPVAEIGGHVHDGVHTGGGSNVFDGISDVSDVCGGDVAHDGLNVAARAVHDVEAMPSLGEHASNLRSEKARRSGQENLHRIATAAHDERMPPKISVVMPAYNEARHIVRNLLETVDTLQGAGHDFEIIVVDDGSPDKTYLEAAKILSSHPEVVRVVHYQVNQGKGNALMCGSWFARGEVVVFLDADMDLHPSQLAGFFEILKREKADVVIGSKRHRLSQVDYPFSRRCISFVYYSLIRILFGLPVKDTQTGIKVFRREVLDRVFPRVLAKRFAFDIEVLANAHRMGYRIVDAPVKLEFRRGTFGRIRVKDVMNITLDTLAIFYRMHILRYYDRLHDKRLSEHPLSHDAWEISRT